jgi:hypothetical protein
MSTRGAEAKRKRFTRWRSAASRQRQLLDSHDRLVNRLLTDLPVAARGLSNRREWLGEWELLKEQIRLLADERARLELELMLLRRADLATLGEWHARERAVGSQALRTGRLLDQWQAEEALGRRRRRRDHLWLHALMLERARLKAESRRIVEQAGIGPR